MVWAYIMENGLDSDESFSSVSSSTATNDLRERMLLSRKPSRAELGIEDMPSVRRLTSYTIHA